MRMDHGGTRAKSNGLRGRCHGRYNGKRNVTSIEKYASLVVVEGEGD